MKRQNSIKRIIISFSLAFATALMTLVIQNSTKNTNQTDVKLEANVFPKNKFLLNK